jgi:hypothetical protein
MRAKLLALAAVAALALAMPETAQAGDWSVRVSVGGPPVARRHVHHHGGHHAGHHVVYVPRRHVHHSGCHVAGHWETRTYRRWVPGVWREEVLPAVWKQYWDPELCRWVKVRLRPRRIRRVWVPGHHERVLRKVWVPGRYVCHP